MILNQSSKLCKYVCSRKNSEFIIFRLTWEACQDGRSRPGRPPWRVAYYVVPDLTLVQSIVRHSGFENLPAVTAALHLTSDHHCRWELTTSTLSN